MKLVENREEITNLCSVLIMNSKGRLDCIPLSMFFFLFYLQRKYSDDDDNKKKNKRLRLSLSLLFCFTTTSLTHFSVYFYQIISDTHEWFLLNRVSHSLSRLLSKQYKSHSPATKIVAIKITSISVYNLHWINSTIKMNTILCITIALAVIIGASNVSAYTTIRSHSSTSSF